MKAIDELAKALAVRYGMPSDIHVPIAARDKESIEKYIGHIISTFQNSSRTNVIVVTQDESEMTLKNLQSGK
ncbi:MAG: hypothetical protein IPP15_13145 [Saprospiraceae bacterium]|uniref:Uncharacterized protein n=1 Tax=Candidatus Opimibacter skivensis TaxID=2982028 RepID=A0A9D7XQS2_9BACT|nr:hypothetical protein [Candidatus Opimibacter skivensis]